jgi:hypothetical protein
MSQSKVNKPSPLILAALHHQTFLNGLPSLTFQNDSLSGVLAVDPLQRNDILDMLGKSRLSPPNQTDYIPLFIPSRKFNTVIDDQAYDYNLGYQCDMDQIDDGGDEALSLMFVLNTSHKTIGFFKLTLTHTQSTEHDHTIQFTLDQILIDPKHRNTTNWMDLTNGTITFLWMMLESLLASVVIEDRIAIYLNADVVSSGGKKIGNIIFNELSYCLDELKQGYPEKSKCIDKIIYHLG